MTVRKKFLKRSLKRSLKRASVKVDQENSEWMARALPLRFRTGKASKEHISLRLDSDVVVHYRASGPGWQTRINATLRAAAHLPQARLTASLGSPSGSRVTRPRKRND
jgi:uncharacterized protein (DUF4415 family)